MFDDMVHARLQGIAPVACAIVAPVACAIVAPGARAVVRADLCQADRA